MYYNQKVVIFSAPSGSGKTTLVKHCLEEFPFMQFSVSATTRAPRGEEQDAKDYYFLSPEIFKKKIAESAFIEYEEVYANVFYGTLNSEMNRIWNDNNVAIFDVDVKGGIKLKEKFRDQALSVFIAPPSIEELKRRLMLRHTDDENSIEVRVAKAKEEMTYANEFDKIIINENLEVAKVNIVGVINRFLGT